jgi:hypothetical protein
MIMLSRHSINILGKAAGRKLNPFTKRNYWGSKYLQDGTVLIGVGKFLLIGAGAGFLLMQFWDYQRDKLFNEFKAMNQNISESDTHEIESWHKKKPLFDCIVRAKVMNFDGYKCLTGVSVGDRVQVLEENVGPGKLYTLCRRVDENGSVLSLGWYPTNCLAKQ